MKSQHGDLEKQLHSLKVASEPRKDEVDRLQELKEIIAAEEKEIERLTKGSKKLKEKVTGLFYIILVKIILQSVNSLFLFWVGVGFFFVFS